MPPTRSRSLAAVTAAAALSTLSACVTVLNPPPDLGRLEPDRSAAQVPADAWPGCYRVDFGWWPGFSSDRLVLTGDTAHMPDEGPPLYAAGPDAGYTIPPTWSLLAPDVAVVEWIDIHHSVLVRLRVAGDSLLGEAGHGGGLGSYTGPVFPRRRFVAYPMSCDLETGSTPDPPVGPPMYEFWSALGLRVGGPQKVAMDWGVIRMPGRLGLALEPGLAGGQVGVGMAAVSPWAVARLQGVLLRTWGDPWQTESNQTLVGLDARLLFGVGVGLGLYVNVSDTPSRGSWLLAPSFVLAF